MTRDSQRDDGDSVAWAHLSDLHFKAGRDYWRDEALRALLRDLEIFAGRRAPARGAERVALDFVVVTGDVAHSGRREEYDLARRFFDDVTKAIGVPAERIFVVPGNHDVDRERDVTGFMTLAGRAQFETFWANLAARRSVGREKLAAYRAFVTELNADMRIPEEQPGGFACSFPCRARRVALLGLSSAWLSGKEHDQGRLITGKEQAYDLAGGVDLPGLTGADLKLALMHHPLEWMQAFDQAELKNLLAEHVDLLLRGHLHETGLKLQVSPGRVLRTIAAGASYAESPRHKAYNVARVSFGATRAVTFWLRAYAPGQHCFVKDVETYAQAEDGTWTWELTGEAGAGRGSRPERGSRTAADVRPYLEKLREQTRWLDIRGIGAKAADQPELERVYTRLRVTSLDTARQRVDAQGAEELHEAHAPLDGPRSDSAELKDLLRWHHNLVLIGDPGAGKTTFLRFAALNVSRALLGDEREACLARLGLDGAPPFPVFVRLGNFGQFLEEHPGRWEAHSPGHFYHYLDALQGDLGSGLPAGYLSQRVKGGGCLLLLDGLDEVPGQALRECVGRIIEAVVTKGNRHVVTCRTRAYEGMVQLAGEFTACHLVNFGPPEIEAFVRHWSRALHRVPQNEAGTAAAQKADDYGRELLGAIGAHAHVRQLTTNPLMLTILAVVHWSRKRLPEQRAELYEAAVSTLLDSRRELSRYPNQVRRECLQAIALRMFEDPRGVRRTLGRAQAAEVAVPLLGVDGREALAFVEDEELHSGLLVSRVAGEVEFWHLTFGEYLTAAALALRGDYWERLAGHLGDERWGEVILLLAGCRRRHGVDLASEFIEKILASGGADAPLPQRARAVGLVARILRDIEPYGGEPARGTGYEVALREVLGIFERGSTVDERVRIEVGEALGQAGDPRIHEDDYANRVLIRGGTFWMGAQKGDRENPGYDPECYGDEGPVHRVTLSEFWMDRYPVTVRQYGRFVQAGAEGYLERRFWRAEGWAWREKAERARPGGWEEQLQHPNWPVTQVSWYEADAYSAWLGARTGRALRLPTEAEWEYAARGTEGRKYPWGNEEPTGQHANFKMRVGRPTPVGIYPLGGTPEGVQELAGNVWEWCRDWRGAYATADQTDPTGPAKGAYRLLRGGGFYDGSGVCRAASRSYRVPELYYDNIGFRCVVVGGRTQ